jgi:hypothetical protein
MADNQNRGECYEGEDQDGTPPKPITGSGINPPIQRRDASRRGQHRPPPPSLEDLLITDSELQREIERLIERLRETPCTVVMMPKTACGSIFSSRHGLIEDLWDAVILLLLCPIPGKISECLLCNAGRKMRRLSNSRKIERYRLALI